MEVLNFYMNVLLLGVGVSAVAVIVSVLTSKYVEQMLKSSCYTKVFGILPSRPFHCDYCMTYWLSLIIASAAVFWFISSTLSLIIGIAIFSLVYTKFGLGDFLTS